MSTSSLSSVSREATAPNGTSMLDSLLINDDLKMALNEAKDSKKENIFKESPNLIEATIKDNEDKEYTLRIEKHGDQLIFKIKVKPDDTSDNEYFVAIFHYNPEDRINARSYIQFKSVSDCQKAKGHALQLVSTAIKAHKVANASRIFCEKGPLTVYEDGHSNYNEKTIHTEEEIKRLKEANLEKNAEEYGAHIEKIKSIFAEIKGVYTPPDHIPRPDIRGADGSRIVTDIRSTQAIEDLVTATQIEENKSTEVIGFPRKSGTNTCWISSLMQMIDSNFDEYRRVFGKYGIDLNREVVSQEYEEMARDKFSLASIVNTLGRMNPFKKRSAEDEELNKSNSKHGKNLKMIKGGK